MRRMNSMGALFPHAYGVWLIKITGIYADGALLKTWVEHSMFFLLPLYFSLQSHFRPSLTSHLKSGLVIIYHLGSVSYNSAHLKKELMEWCTTEPEGNKHNKRCNIYDRQQDTLQFECLLLCLLLSFFLSSILASTSFALRFAFPVAVKIVVPFSITICLSPALSLLFRACCWLWDASGRASDLVSGCASCLWVTCCIKIESLGSLPLPHRTGDIVE